QCAVDAINRVAMLGRELGEELEDGDLLLVFIRVLGPMTEDHVVEPLVRGSGYFRAFDCNSDVFVERAFPMELLIIVNIAFAPKAAKDRGCRGHEGHSLNREPVAGRQSCLSEQSASGW